MEKVIELLKNSGALLEGHFLLSSGRHSDTYFQCAKLLQYPDKARLALEDTVKLIMNDITSGKLKVDLVVGPAMGGIIAAWEVARQLKLPSIFTERDENGKMVLRRGFEIKDGENIFIMEDVVTTGKSSLECMDALKSYGGIISGLGCVIDIRTENTNQGELPFYPALKVIAVEPSGSSVLSGGQAGSHKIQGIGAGFIPSVYDGSIVDEVFIINEEDAKKTAKLLAGKEGIFAGISSGAAMEAALSIAKRAENKGKTIVVILPDSGERYLSTWLWEE